MTSTQNPDQPDTQASEGGGTTSASEGGEAKPDSTNGTGAAPDDDHQDDSVSGVGPEDPS